LIQKRYRVK